MFDRGRGGCPRGVKRLPDVNGALGPRCNVGPGEIHSPSSRCPQPIMKISSCPPRAGMRAKSSSRLLMVSKST